MYYTLCQVLTQLLYHIPIYFNICLLYQVRRLEEAAVHNDEEMLSIEEKRWAAMK